MRKSPAHNGALNKEAPMMLKTGLLVRLEAKPGKEVALENFLRAGLALAKDEGATPIWFALRIGPSTYGIFDAFFDEAGRQQHLTGKIAKALMANATELLACDPQIEKVDVLESKLAC
jgi:quinol monooxygenase YgiN